MLIIELLLLATFICIPIYEWLKGDKTKSQVQSGALSKIQCYRHTIMFLWCPVGLLILYLWTNEIAMHSIGLNLALDMAQLIAFCLLGCVILYFAISVWRLSKNSETQQAVKQQMADVSWLMPTSKSELRWFVWGVSLSAGLCEELLFRGFLIGYLQPSVGLTMAILIASSLFGLCHIYQGWHNVIRTGIVGLALALIYVWSGSLLVAIILHFAIDTYSGCLYFIATRDELSNEIKGCL